jgi:hypothetical protein
MSVHVSGPEFQAMAMRHEVQSLPRNRRQVCRDVMQHNEHARESESSNTMNMHERANQATQ